MILTICFSSILLISILVLSILQTNTKINLPNPDSIKIYKKSTTTSKTYAKGSDEYNSIVELYNSMFEKTYLKQLSDDDIISGEIAEDLSAPLWVDANYETGVFVEFLFDSAKKVILFRDGNSRRVDVSSIMFQITKENKTSKLYVYYKLPSTSSDSSSKSESTTPTTTEPCYPLVTQANTHELYKFITSKD